MRSDPLQIEAHVGDVLPISALFSISGQANIGDPNRQAGVGGFADGRNLHFPAPGYGRACKVYNDPLMS